MFWVGLLLFAVVGGETAALVSGASMLGGDGDGVARFVVAVNLLPWTLGLASLLVWQGRRRRLGLAEKGPMSPALARVESAEATGEGPNHRMRLDLTVAPKGRAAYRVHATAGVNVMHLQDFRAGRTLDVEYDPERPWRVRVPGQQDGTVQVPLDSAAEATREAEPKGPPAYGAVAGTLLAAVAGAVLYVAEWGF